MEGLDVKYLYIQPLKMEPIEGPETSAYNNQTPGKHPKEYIIYSQGSFSTDFSLTITQAVIVRVSSP